MIKDGCLPFGKMELAMAIKRIENEYTAKSMETSRCVSARFHDLEKVLGRGFQPGTLALVGSAPGIGKSTFVLNIAEYAAIKQKKSVFVLMTDMGADCAYLKILSSLSRIE